MKNIGYVLFSGTVDSGLIKGQVLELLTNIDNKYKIYLFQFIPFYKVFSFSKVCKLNKELKENNIKVVFLPVTLPLGTFIFNRLFVLFSYIYGTLLLILSYIFKINILHCRSYFATSLGVKCKKIKTNLKVIFDTRSLFIEENISSENIKFNSSIYQRWKKEEKKLLNNSDKVVIIDNSFIKYYSDHVQFKTVLKKIPIFVNDRVVYYSRKARNIIRNELELKNKIVITYVGSFGGWNNPKLYSEYFKKIIENNKKIFFLIITKEQKKIKRELMKQEISENNYFITSCEHDSIYKYLSASDYGIMVMEKNLDSDTRLGVKFIEYLATGLIPLLNKNVGAAYKIIKDNKIGMDIDSVIKLKSPSVQEKNNIINFYKNNFNSEIIINKYNEIYREL